MDDISSSSLLIVILLILLHAVVTLFYGALVNARRSYLNDLAEDDDPRAIRVLKLIEENTNLPITYKLFTILLEFGIATAAGMGIAIPMLEAETPMVGLAVLVMVLATLATLILGEIVPESIATVHADRLAMIGASWMTRMVQIAKPVVWLLIKVSQLISALFGSARVINKVTEEEIMTLVNAGHSGGTIEEEEKDMIYSVLQLDQTLAREAMTPRMDIIALDIKASLEDALKSFIDSGFSRIPTYEDNIDNITGVLYLKDLLPLWSGTIQTDKSLRDLIRSAYFVPETKRADELLKEMQDGNVHLALVVDEYGGTAGLVTIENLIEEIVGDIRDEFDINEEADYTFDGEGDYIVDAGMDIDDLNDLLDIDLENEDAETLGGYIFSVIGRVPDVGEIIDTEEATLKVESIEGRRIRKVRITQKDTDESEDEDTKPTEQNRAGTSPENSHEESDKPI